MTYDVSDSSDTGTGDSTCWQPITVKIDLLSMGKVDHQAAGRRNELSVPTEPNQNSIPGRYGVQVGSAGITGHPPRPREG